MKIIRIDGDGKHWLLDGVFHREDGPAVEWAGGSKSWWLYGRRHRVDGPAVEGAYGTTSWYLNGKEYTEEEFYENNILR